MSRESQYAEVLMLKEKREAFVGDLALNADENVWGADLVGWVSVKQRSHESIKNLSTPVCTHE